MKVAYLLFFFGLLQVLNVCTATFSSGAEDFFEEPKVSPWHKWINAFTGWNWRHAHLENELVKTSSVKDNEITEKTEIVEYVFSDEFSRRKNIWIPGRRCFKKSALKNVRAVAERLKNNVDHDKLIEDEVVKKELYLFLNKQLLPIKYLRTASEIECFDLEKLNSAHESVDAAIELIFYETCENYSCSIEIQKHGKTILDVLKNPALVISQN